jgi:hypothetical protein
MENNSSKNIFVGIIAAILVFGLIVFAIETKKSLLQALVGFGLFVIPFTFLSSFKSKVSSFILALITLIILYTCYKFGYTDIWIGVLMAGIIGGSAFYFRVNKVTTFDAEDYIEKAKNQHRNKKNE